MGCLLSLFKGKSHYQKIPASINSENHDWNGDNSLLCIPDDDTVLAAIKDADDFQNVDIDDVELENYLEKLQVK